MRYESKQYGHLTVTSIAFTVVVLLTTALLVPDFAARVLCAIMALFFVLVGLLFMTLTVSVEDSQVRISFGVGLIRRQIPIERIQSASPVLNRWWYGFGIRKTPHGWMWNIQGLSAVELLYTDGGRFRIGTLDPEGLTAAITAACKGQAPA